MSEAHSRLQLRKKIEGYRESFAENGIMLASVLISPPEAKKRRTA